MPTLEPLFTHLTSTPIPTQQTSQFPSPFWLLLKSTHSAFILSEKNLKFCYPSFVPIPWLCISTNGTEAAYPRRKYFSANQRHTQNKLISKPVQTDTKEL